MSKSELRGILLGDAMIPSPGFVAAWDKYLGDFDGGAEAGEWESDWGQLQYRRLEVEKQGPEIESVPEKIAESDGTANVVAGLFVPINTGVFDALPDLRVVGVCRAGLENVNVEEANKRGVAVLNVMGRNAHAVSDFAVGMMIAEARNIARAHYSIKNNEWRKTFANSAHVPEMADSTVGLVGFGYIGQLVAKKLSGFGSRVVVYDPYAKPEVIEAAGVEQVELDDLLRQSDFVSLHARLTDENKGMINAERLALMKPTAVLVNTGRAGLVDQDALAEALSEGRIAGAALDVFTTEPLPEGSPLRELDNVTLTTHIAGTTEGALSNSPFLLMEDMAKLLKGEQPRFLVNPQVLEDERFKSWLEGLQA